MKPTEYSAFLKEIVLEVLNEAIIANDDIRDIKGKIVESVQVNDTAVILHFDDDSKFTIQTSGEDKIQYQYHRGMLKPNSSAEGFGGDPTPT